MLKKFIGIGIMAFVLVTFIAPTEAFAQFKKITKEIEIEEIEIAYFEGDVEVIRVNGGKWPMYRAGDNQKIFHALAVSGRVANGGYTVNTGANSFVTFYLNNQTVGVMTSKTFLKLDANSSMIVSQKGDKALVKVTKGTLSEDTKLKELAKMNDFMTFLSSVNTQRIQKQVNDWKSGRNNDQLANHIISQKSTKAGFVGGVVGLGGAVMMPADLANIAAQWLIQAEMAYALACVYGTPPKQADFINDLYILFTGESVFKEILKEVGAETFLKVGEKATKKFVSSQAFQNVSKKVIEKMPQRLTNLIAAKGAKFSGKSIPFAGGALAAAMDGTEA